ncbi:MULTISPECIES: DUF1330 domain-containing protein [unclassified Paracoccus (in: a-proteobacteria)]|uniref:DUF1330 domain-containing protein n=1 Tax=unclassified Paracoccus (in: a-proteobacteria) TaxID=2688777 RepID=UPI00160360E6|nr:MULTISPECIES: DUF1330 domain-containing protein [unclassified Paracoccus (in: a-proteobacteria)]MBB1491885.1 DUF1330 domain-containing protein [Paracoccus sp. MC1854]MBB1498252.1 DUF1330 domain-containing protein [Paracoccus sp. MC1862]QQO45739.1 DUF1330 domain-containing protein [Paracoccus sp. MC1862]
MAKAYWIAHVTIDDLDAYQAYRQANAAAFAKYGGRFLVRGGPQTVMEGAVRPRAVVIEFPSMKAAQDCYRSPEYQAALALRQPVSTADLIIVEGHDEPKISDKSD